jgi:hypothetical protein
MNVKQFDQMWSRRFSSMDLMRSLFSEKVIDAIGLRWYGHVSDTITGLLPLAWS